MSDKLAMPNVEKVEVKLTIRAPIVAKIDKMRKLVGFSRNEMCNSLLDSATKAIALDADDLAEINAMIQHNMEKRQANKTRKGIL